MSHFERSPPSSDKISRRDLARKEGESAARPGHAFLRDSKPRASKTLFEPSVNSPPSPSCGVGSGGGRKEKHRLPAAGVAESGGRSMSLSGGRSMSLNTTSRRLPSNGPSCPERGRAGRREGAGGGETLRRDLVGQRVVIAPQSEESELRQYVGRVGTVLSQVKAKTSGSEVWGEGEDRVIRPSLP